MADFRFRAAAALELRRRQENDAGAALALAEGRFHRAEASLEAGVANRSAAQTTQIEEARKGTSVAALEWHRNWIIRLAATVDRLRHQVEVQAGAVREAEMAWRNARRRRLGLERMKDRASRRFQHEQNRQELKMIDELARLRFALPGFGDERNEP